MTDKRIDTQGRIEAVRFQNQTGSPAAPAAGYSLLYMTTSGLYMKTSGGAVIGPLVTGTAPSQAAGAMTFVSSLTGSASATLDFTGLVAGYDYMLVLENLLPATDNVSLLLQVGTGGTPTYQTASYLWAIMSANSAGGSGAAGSASDSSISLATFCGNGAGRANFGKVYAIEPADTTNSKRLVYSVGGIQFTGNFAEHSGGATWASNTAVTAIRLKFSSGDIASGVVHLYKIAKS